MLASNRQFDPKHFSTSKVHATFAGIFAGTVAILAVALTAAGPAGCGPATPHTSVAPTTMVVADAGVDAARTASASAGDAPAERVGTPVAVPSTSTATCVPGAGPSGPDGGALPVQPMDASVEVQREAGVDVAAPDGGAAQDSNAGSGGRAGAAGGSGGGGGGSGGSNGIGSGGATGGSRAAGGTVGGAASGGAAGGGAMATGGVAATGGAATGGSRATGGTVGSAATGGSASGGAASSSTGGATIGGGGNSGASPGPGDLAIVELLINPAGTDTGREWIEVVNRTTHAVSLVGLHVSDAVNDAALDLGAGEIESLAAGGRAILIQSSDPTKNGGVAVGAATPGGSFGTLVSLNNDADTISICFGACATGVVVDRVAWDASLGTGYDGHALVIDDSARRCPATAPFGDGGSFGTPGAANTPCP